MRTGIRRALAVVAGSLLIGGINPVPASAADATPPRLNLLPYAAFVQGGVIGPSAAPAPDDLTFTSDIPMVIRWSGDDASGICGYDVNAEFAGAEPSALVSGTRRTRYDGRVTDYDDQFGGGSFKIDAWQVVARDCAGNSAAKSAGVRATVTQEDGTSNGYGTATVGYTGTWGTSTCACWSHGAVRRTTQKGAAATIRFPTRANGTAALVMEKAPNRGRFTLFLDGVNRATIDTHATVATHRVIVWSGRFATTGTHVVRIVNQATPGRPRIDLDAVLQNT